MSDTECFKGSAVAALALWDKWSVLTGEPSADAGPSLQDLQAVCRQAGCVVPELDAYTHVKGRRPALLLCGGDNMLAEQMAALMGYEIALPEVPEACVVWGVDGGKDSEIRVRKGESEQSISRMAILDYLGSNPSDDEWYMIDERVQSSAAWRFLWVPYPKYFRTDKSRPSDLEILLSQNASVVITEQTPVPMQKLLEEMGQKYWPISQNDLTTAEERTRLLRDLSVLWDHRPQDLNLARNATWLWFTGRLTAVVSGRKREYQQVVNQYEIKLSSSRHMLTQYKKNMTNGVRTIVEAYLQNRVASQAFTAFYDAGKAGPQTDTFIGAVSLPALWTKLDEYVTDRLADFITGLAGLATKLDLQRISLGDANARWASRTLNGKLEHALNDRKIFPEGGGKRGGLVGNLTGRKQEVVDDRKAQILKAVRVLVQFIELEFQSWCGQLMNIVENGVSVQLAAALAQRGYAELDILRKSTEGLIRLESLLQGDGVADATATLPPVAAGWMNSLSDRRWIPLYHPA